MRVAEDIAKDGMTAQGELLEFMSDLITTKKLTKVIETGTYLGTGSTMAIINALMKHGQPYNFYSIECNPHFYRQAKRNVPRLRGIHLVNGLSVSVSDLPMEVDLSEYENSDIIVDHQEKDREQKYLSETKFDVPDDALEDCLHAFNYKPDLVMLDSAGHMGWIELRYLLDRVNDPFYLVLDDTNHIKHANSAAYMRHAHEVIFESDDKFGGMVARVNVWKNGKIQE